jgi:hypothetical protein
LGLGRWPVLALQPEQQLVLMKNLSRKYLVLLTK